MVGYVIFFKFTEFAKTKIYISKVYFLCLLLKVVWNIENFIDHF